MGPALEQGHIEATVQATPVGVFLLAFSSQRPPRPPGVLSPLVSI